MHAQSRTYLYLEFGKSLTPLFRLCFREFKVGGEDHIHAETTCTAVRQEA